MTERSGPRPGRPAEETLARLNLNKHEDQDKDSSTDK